MGELLDRLEDVEQGAARILHHHPLLITGLPDVRVAGALFERPLTAGLEVVGTQVEVDRPLRHRVLRRLDQQRRLVRTADESAARRRRDRT